MEIEEVYDLLKSNEAILIDVREEIEHKNNNINDAILMPLSTFNPEKIKDLIEKNKTIIIHCQSGGRSLRVCEIINNFYNNKLDIYNMNGGISAWNRFILNQNKNKHQNEKISVDYFFDETRTKTITYIVTDLKTKKCAIIDPVLDYDQSSAVTYTENADKVINFIKDKKLELEWILETHIHADHLTSSQYIKSKLGGKIAIGENIKKVLSFWNPIFQDNDIMEDGSQFDQLFKDEEEFYIGESKMKVIYTPGHTPACVSYLIYNYLFTGDTIFSPLVGTARTDFPGGNSSDLFDSVQKIYKLPNDTKICVGHEYPQNNQMPIIITTVGEQKKANKSINETTKKEDYIAIMNEKQTYNPVPQLILPSLHVNLLAGKVPNIMHIPTNKLAFNPQFKISGGCSAGGCSSKKKVGGCGN